MSELKATTNAGTIDDPIPQELIWKDAQGKFYKVAGTGGSSSGADPRVGDLADLNTTDKTTVVAAINEVNLKQATGGAPDANDINKGVTKLSDAIDSDLNATDGVTAATPLAVKNVNSKIGDLNQLTTTAKNNLVAALNEVKANGGSGGVNYVTTPQVTSPTEGATKVSTLTTIVGTQYENIFANDLRKNRVFELSKSAGFDSDVVTLNANADSATVNKSLDGNTQYYVRIKDVSQKDRESNWSPVVSFTTGDAIQANTPTITLKGYNDSPDDIGSGLTIEGSAFALSDTTQSDTHASTSWVITANSRAPVWQSLNDQTNKTSIEVPKGTLQKGTAYTVTVTYHATKFADSAPAVKQFTTSNDFGTVQAPVVSVTGAPNKVYETPTISGGVFSNTREPDTHAATEIKILLSENMSTVWKHTVESATTSVVVPKGNLATGKQYKVQMRYKGATLGWSEWSELSFTTVNEFTRYNYIGVPGTSTFGVGLAEEKDYRAVGLKPTDHCLDPTDFQYGQYYFGEDTSQGVGTVDMKWIPKFYIKQLQKNEGAVNLNDAELEALLPYVEVTKEQMKEAQRRSPHNALVVAPASSFTNEADANAHGFYLMRGFIDGGKEYNGFFIANALTTYGNVGSKYFLCLGQRGFRNGWTKSDSPLLATTDLTSNPLWPNKPNGVSPKYNFIFTLEETKWNCCSIHAWAVISILSLIQGQYATNNIDCAWYDATLRTNYPKGINKNGLTDCDDPDVTLNSPFATAPNVFVDDIQEYNKTTHNGSVTGITNVNGWLWQYVIGLLGSGSNRKMLKRSASIYDITYNNVDSNSSPYYESKNTLRISHDWGGDKSSLPDLAGDDRDFFGIYAFGGNADRNSNEFGMDVNDHYYNHRAVCVGNTGYSDNHAGVFCRGSDNWTSLVATYGFRAMAYPRELPVTVTANCPEGTPSTQTVVVPKGTTLGEAKKKLVTPTATNKVFKEWRV